MLQIFGYLRHFTLDTPTKFFPTVRQGCTAVLVATSLACLAPKSHGELIVTDHFLGGIPGDPLLGEYDNTPFLNQFRRGNANGGGQDPTVAGFTGPWFGNVTSGSLGVAQWTAEVDGIFGTPYGQGGRARFGGGAAFVSNRSLQRRVQRELSPYTASDTYYFSLVSQVLTSLDGADVFVGVGFTNTGATVTATDANIVGGNELRGFLIGPAGNGMGTDYVVRHVGSTGAVQNDVILSDIVQNTPEGSPFIRTTIAKLEFNDDPGNPNGNSKITIWQDPSDVSSEAAASASVTPLEFRTFALDTNADITHLTMTGIGYSRAASFDEPRFATSWDAVAGGTADFNNDGFVDGSDFLAWQRGFGIDIGATLDQGDGNADGAVDGLDLALWNFYFGRTSAAPPALVATVPEPSSLALFAVVLPAFLRASRNRVRFPVCRQTLWRY